MIHVATFKKRMCAALVAAIESGARPNLPDGGSLLWKWFIDLHSSRTFHTKGPNPISFAEIEAYARFSQWPIRMDHADIITAMDVAWREDFQARRRRERDNDQKKLPPRSDYPVSTGLFDAMFG